MTYLEVHVYSVLPHPSPVAPSSSLIKNLSLQHPCQTYDNQLEGKMCIHKYEISNNAEISADCR